MPDDHGGLGDIMDRLHGLAASQEMTISVVRRWRGLFIVEGLGVQDLWTDVFEPVRRRLLWSRRWTASRPLLDAERAIRSFLINRPDLDRPAP